MRFESAYFFTAHVQTELRSPLDDVVRRSSELVLDQIINLFLIKPSTKVLPEVGG